MRLFYAKRTGAWVKYYFLGLQVWVSHPKSLRRLMLEHKDNLNRLSEQNVALQRQLNALSGALESVYQKLFEQNVELRQHIDNLFSRAEERRLSNQQQLQQQCSTLVEEQNAMIQQCFGMTEDHLQQQLSVVIRQNSWGDIYRLAALNHPHVFAKYKNCNLGKDMVLVAAGPTLDDYVPQQDVLYLGVNRTFRYESIKLDYIFVQDFIPDAQEQMDAYVGNNCKKFYGVHYLVPGIPENSAEKAAAERYYFIDLNLQAPWPFPLDLSVQPLMTYSSIVHPAVEFALWTGARRIYLVGCDTNLGGYFGAAGSNQLSVDNVLYGWKKLKEFAHTFYPEAEIISINPVGLRGLFRDLWTRTYLNKHPEIKPLPEEIIA